MNINSKISLKYTLFDVVELYLFLEYEKLFASQQSCISPAPPRIMDIPNVKY